MSNPIPNNSANSYGSSFLNGACAAAGGLFVQHAVKHVEKYSKPDDPCGLDALCAKVTLVAVQLKHSVVAPLLGETVLMRRAHEEFVAELSRRI